MTSSISLAVLLAIVVNLVLGTRIYSTTNEISDTERATNKVQAILDLYYSKLQSSLDRDIHSTLAEGFKILDETYRYEFLIFPQITKAVLKDDHYRYSEANMYDYITIINPIKELKIANGKYYYNNDSSSNQYYPVRTDDGGYEKASVIKGNAFPSFFDSITISYPEEKLLTFGNIEIKTEKPYVKYRVAHHLLEKLFFIGFNSTEANTGTLFSADLRAAEKSSVQANQILLDMNENEFLDVAVDQYTGDILLATESKIFALHKMLYFSNVNQFASSPHGTQLVET